MLLIPHDIDNWRRPPLGWNREKTKIENYNLPKRNVSQPSQPHLGLVSRSLYHWALCRCVILIAMSADHIIRKKVEKKDKAQTIDMAAVGAAARTLQIQLRSLRSADIVLHYNNPEKMKCRHLVRACVALQARCFVPKSKINAITAIFFSIVFASIQRRVFRFCVRSIHASASIYAFSAISFFSTGRRLQLNI